jgi:hypothetical protein
MKGSCEFILHLVNWREELDMGVLVLDVKRRE